MCSLIGEKSAQIGDSPICSKNVSYPDLQRFIGIGVCVPRLMPQFATAPIVIIPRSIAMPALLCRYGVLACLRYQCDKLKTSDSYRCDTILRVSDGYRCDKIFINLLNGTMG